MKRLFVTAILLCGFAGNSFAATSKIVIRFVFFGASTSKPIGSGTVQVEIRNRVYEKMTTSKGWLVLNVPCNTEGTVSFGDDLEYSQDINIPCSKKPVGIGLFDWKDGEYISDDMDNVDGCRLCN